jgi:hypothetical protein
MSDTYRLILGLSVGYIIGNIVLLLVLGIVVWCERRRGGPRD